MQAVRVQAGLVTIGGVLSIPDGATGVVVVAYPSGSCRNNPRSHHLMEEFNEYGLAVLLLDLMTAREEEEDLEKSELRFNTPLLADRIVGALSWVSRYGPTKHLKVGMLGTSTSTAAVLVAASRLGSEIAAIVSRGGRPDLAGESLKHLITPSLFIVGENDQSVLELNQKAMNEIEGKKRLEVIPEAGHHFIETGTFELAAHAARRWFLEYLR